MLLPELEPIIKWKCPWTGYDSPIFSSNACRKTNGMIPLTPPPSMLRSLTVAVGGITFTLIPDVSAPQRKH
jgi:hypothetical protein